MTEIFPVIVRNGLRVNSFPTTYEMTHNSELTLQSLYQYGFFFCSRLFCLYVCLFVVVVFLLLLYTTSFALLEVRTLLYYVLYDYVQRCVDIASVELRYIN